MGSDVCKTALCSVFQGTNDVYQFLSGVPITANTTFLSLRHHDVQTEYKKVVYYMRSVRSALSWEGCPQFHKTEADREREGERDEGYEESEGKTGEKVREKQKRGKERFEGGTQKLSLGKDTKKGR